jgi:hypothetical protein
MIEKWQEQTGPAEDWTEQNTAFGKLKELKGTERQLFISGAALAILGLLALIISVLSKIGAFELIRGLPSIFVPMGILMVGLAVASIGAFRILRN